MASESCLEGTAASTLRRGRGLVTDSANSLAKRDILHRSSRNMTDIEPRTPAHSSVPGTHNGFPSFSDILNMKTPEFRPCVPSSTIKENIDKEISATDIKKNLYASLVYGDKSCAAQTTGEGSKGCNSGTLSNSSSVRKEFVPPILRRLREDPSLKNVRFDFRSQNLSEDDDEREENEESGENGEEKSDNPSSLSKGSHSPCPSLQSAKSTVKQSAEKENIYESCRDSVENKQLATVPSKPLPHQASHIRNAPLSHERGMQNEDASHLHNSGQDTSTITLNGNCYYIFSTIGSGGSSKVYEVYDDKKHTYAVKFVDLQNEDEQVTAMFLNEVTILRQLRNCERVVRLYDYEYCEEKKMLCLLMEKGETDLAGVLRPIMRANSLNPITVKFYWSEMLQAVKEIHEKGIIHSDLKPANFLFVKGKLKLIDFGIADTMQADVTSVVKSSQMGTLNFMSPESIMGTGEISKKTGRPDIKINTKSDVWSLGCILYNLVYGRSPFQDQVSAPQKLHAITNKKHRIPFPEIADAHLYNVLQQCLQRDPKQRPTIAELLQHPYLVEGKSRVASAKPEVASLLTTIESLSPCSLQKVQSYVRAIQKK